MTPKEKAKELIDKFYQSQVESLNKIGLTEFIEVEHEIAVKSSLIAVDEIIKAIDWQPFGFADEAESFWQEVKKELEAL